VSSLRTNIWERSIACAAALVAGCARSTPTPLPHPAAEPSSSGAARGSLATPAVESPAAVRGSAGMGTTGVDRGPFQLAAACDGSCEFGLSSLAGERALALWNTPEGSWAQRFDLALGSSLGPPLAIGTLAEQSQLPYVFALPDGDVAIFGVLADGRVTFARGSDVAARRVPPRVVVASGSQGVRTLAASGTAAGLALFLLRRVDPKDERAEDPQVGAELYWLDDRGESSRAPLIWKTRLGIQARLEACGEQLYLAWDSVPGAQVIRMSSRGRVDGQMLLPPPDADLQATLGPLLCTRTGAKLIAGWKHYGDFDLQPSVSRAGIAATGPLPERGKWMTSALSSVPHELSVREYPFGTYVASGRLHLLVDAGDEWGLVALDLDTGKSNPLPGSVKLPAAMACVPSSDGRRALCVAPKRSQPVPECRRKVTRLDAAFFGAAAPSSASSSVAVTAPYFATGTSPIPDPLAPSEQALAERRSQLWCGEPGWSGLVKAVEDYCVDLRRKRDAATKKSKRKELDETLSGYCDPKSHSVLFQATHCTDQPLACQHDPVSDVLSVDRAEFEAGSDWLSMDIFDRQCQVWFSGKGDSWKVVDHECNGD
jgi:hypothetical protein